MLLPTGTAIILKSLFRIDKDLKFYVDVLGVQVIDENGFAVAKGRSEAVRARGGQPHKVLNYRLAPVKR